MSGIRFGHRQRGLILFAMLAALLVVLTLTAGGAEAGKPGSDTDGLSTVARQAAPGSKISGELRTQFHANPNARIKYVAVLKAQADLKDAWNIKDWNARGQYVLDSLQGVANSTQPAVRTYLEEQIQRGHISSYKAYYIVNAFQVVGDLTSAENLAALPEISSVEAWPVIELDTTSAQAAPGPDTIEWNVSHIRAPAAWAMDCNGHPCNGYGVTAGSLDTGARYTHIALINQYRGNLGGGSFDHNYNWWDTMGASQYPVDEGGSSSYHGSHTIGTMVGDDGAGNQIGVAPGARWISSNGIASAGDPIVAGQFMLAPWDLSGQNPDPTKRPKVVGNSWGYGGSSYNCAGATFFRDIVQAWRAADIFPSFSSGNAGTSGNRPPSAYPETFESGSIDVGWGISYFSSRGPSCFDGGQHPQVVTGGGNVRSVNGGGDTGYTYMSGTSMAQPASAGAVAIIRQANPSLTVEQVWYILTSTAVMSPSWGTRPNITYGWGVVQLDAAVAMAQGNQGTPTPTVPVPPSNTPTHTPTEVVGTATPTSCPQGNWTVASPVPTAKGRALGVTMGNSVYVFGGRPDNAYFDQAVYRYDTATDTWTLLTAQIPDQFTSNMAGGVLTFPEGQRIFLVSGTGPGSTYTERTLTFNPTDGTFATKADWPVTTGTRMAGAAVVHNNKMYVFGGLQSSVAAFAEIWVYDPSNNSWTQNPASLSLARGYIAAELMPDGLIYLGGGSAIDGANLTNETVFEKFNPANNTIVTGPPLPAGTSNTQGFNLGGKFVVPGGHWPDTIATVQVYDPNSNSWGSLPDMPTGTRNFAKGYGVNGVIHAIGGISNDSTGDIFQDVNQVFAPAGCATPTPEPPTVTPVPPTATPGGATPTPCTIEFTDVPVGSTFYPYVRCLACRGVLSGYADNTFRPNNNITRGQIAKVVSNAAAFNDEIPQDRQTYTDVPNTNTFWLWIERLTVHGVMSGYNCGVDPNEPCDPQNRAYFRWANNATRAQLAKIDSNAAGFSDEPTTQTFTDVPSTHPFYVWIERLATRGIMGGYQCGIDPNEPCDPQNRPYFRPYNNVTRGQAAKIVANTFYPNCETPR